MAGIRRPEKDPDHDNIFKSLTEDTVGRNKDLWQFASFCSAQESRCSIALDGGWGTGKTFFLKQLEMLFNCLDLKKNEQEEIAKTFVVFQDSNTSNKIKPHVCVYYDAWKNDNAEDPLCSILYTLIKDTKNRLLFFVPNKAVHHNKLVGKFSCLLNRFQLFLMFCPYMKILLCLFEQIKLFHILHVAMIAKIICDSNPVRKNEQQRRFHDCFSWYLKSLVPRNEERLIVLIDELDRCKPSYAVLLLERIKHYLSNERITFVFAVNKDQLQHTIRAYYGDDFDAYRYLNRFFNHSFSLPPANIERFMISCGMLQTGKTFDFRLYADICLSFIKVYKLPLRESSVFWQSVELACQTFKNEIEKNNNISWKFVMYIIVPIVLGLKLYNNSLLDDFVKGKNIDPLLDVLRNSPVGNRFLEHPDQAILEEHFNPENINWDILPFTEAIFIKLFAEEEFAEKKIMDPLPYDTSPFDFNQEMKDTIFTASNLMADFIKFDTNTEEPAHG